ncbi:MAG TPA: 3-oxoacyl-ACP reductase family protein [Acidimicrobiales bacterium]|nr:3-oxoacyl-ACP reductase family protein [Acidimicrobiales bacterium]
MSTVSNPKPQQGKDVGALGAFPATLDPRAGDLAPSSWRTPEGDEGLSGRTVIVTGAGRNIGRAIALTFGDAGCNVVVNARSNGDEAAEVVDSVNAGPGKAIAVLGDVGDPDFDEELVRAAVDRFGGVDCLINNAGRRRLQSLLDITPEDWDTILRSNLSAMFYLSRLVLPGMVERRWGRIINIGGPDGQSGAPFRAHNVTCKAGLIGLVKAISIEFAHAGITANVVVPGMMDTTRSPIDYPGWPPSQQTISSRVPTARLGTSDEVAYACRFLSSHAAAYVTGQTLHVNGGMYMP